MKQRILNLSYGIAFLWVLGGCYPGGAEYTSDTDIVVTHFNDEFDFKSVKTYFMSDSINHIVEEGKEPDYSLDQFVISELEKQFDAIGYVRLMNEDTTGPAPDVVILVSAIKVKNYQIWGGYPWYPGWGWGWGWGYYKSSDETNYWGYPGYGWGYPYYPTYVTSFETGTISWNMVDPDNIDEENEVLYVEWIGALNGVLGSSTASTKDRISKGLNQAFEQSPYLKEE